MSKWLARARNRDGSLPLVPIVPNVPEPPPEVHQIRPVGTNGTFGTGGRHRIGRGQAVAEIAIDDTQGAQTAAPEIDQDEREAIAIELGGVPEGYAAAFAQIQAYPPPDVPPRRWDMFINDAGLFFDRWGKQAARLGWPLDDLFGADLQRPDELLWSLASQFVTGLTDRIAILSNGERISRRSRR